MRLVGNGWSLALELVEAELIGVRYLKNLESGRVNAMATEKNLSKGESVTRFFGQRCVWPLAGLLFLSSCQIWDREEEGLKTLHFQLSADPVSLDPTAAEDGNSLRILALTQDTLLRLSSKGELVPGLAERWEFQDGKRKIRFFLKSGIKWSDGVPLKAEHFKLAFERARDPRSVSKLGSYLEKIEKIEAEDLVNPTPSEAVTRGGALTLTLRVPDPTILSVLAIPMMVPLREDVLKGNQGKWPAVSPGTGPYFISKHVLGQTLTFSRNPFDRGAQQISKDSINRLKGWIVTEEQTALRLFEQGKLDILSKVPGSALEKLKKAAQLHRAPFWATYYLSFNFRDAKNPFVQSRILRKAFSLALDRPGLLRAIDSPDTPALGFIPRELFGPLSSGSIPDSSESRFSDSDWEAARSEVKRFGLDRQPVELAFDSSQRNSQILEKVQMDVEKKLGLKIQLRQRDWRSHLANLRTQSAPIFRMGWLAAFADPLSHLHVFVTGGPNNLSGYSSPVYDAWVQEIASLENSVKRQMLIQTAEEWLTQKEFVVVPIFHYVQTHGVSQRVRGFDISPLGTSRWDQIELLNNAN